MSYLLKFNTSGPITSARRIAPAVSPAPRVPPKSAESKSNASRRDRENFLFGCASIFAMCFK